MNIQEMLNEVNWLDRPYVFWFCKSTNNRLVGISETYENDYKEQSYLFSDGLGYYTIDGVRETLFNEDVGEWN